ncbi:cytochrome C [Pseudomonas sp. CFBP13528]|uniref:Cytochrome C n=1 Tax=Pseudomonas fluorescens TaxID=294 RepID=A0A2N1DZS6_PSEFL|nr:MULTISPECIES: cytochrome C [Pseudomonas]PKH17645.1 cytochrome C [Pseudomonas fluorescens]TKK35702.1 cytochrome C [Pseudomonas sp. CFBP13528]
MYNRVCVVTLMQRVTRGFKAMPPRGLCMDCSTEDYQAINELMVSKPGR